MILAIGLANIPIFARIIRASVMAVKEKQFIEAGKALGANNGLLIFKHILPNILSPVIVHSSMGVATANFICCWLRIYWLRYGGFRCGMGNDVKFWTRLYPNTSLPDDLSRDRDHVDHFILQFDR